MDADSIRAEAGMLTMKSNCTGSRRVMRLSTLLVFPVVMGIISLAGCTDPNALAGDVVATPPGTISVYQLAGRLGLYVAESSQYSATLRNTSNTVMLYAEPAGGVFVNGQKIATEGGVVCASGLLFAPVDSEQTIRMRMRSGNTTAPMVASRVPVKPTQPLETERTVPQGKVKGRVVIDAGHGGKDPGTTAASRNGGRTEASINLALALIVMENLRQRGVEVLPTRRDNTFIELDDRSAVANRSGADMFVAIHCDSAANTSVNGFKVYTSRSPSSASSSLAHAVEKRMAACGANSRGLGEAGYRVLVHTTCPAILIESGCLSNASEAASLSDPSYQAKLGRAIADGIADALQRK